MEIRNYSFNLQGNSGPSRFKAQGKTTFKGILGSDLDLNRENHRRDFLDKLNQHTKNNFSYEENKKAIHDLHNSILRKGIDATHRINLKINEN